MSPDRPDEFVNQPQPGGSDDHERPEQDEMPQCLSMGDLELSQGDPGEQGFLTRLLHACWGRHPGH